MNRANDAIIRFAFSSLSGMDSHTLGDWLLISKAATNRRQFGQMRFGRGEGHYCEWCRPAPSLSIAADRQADIANIVTKFLPALFPG